MRCRFVSLLVKRFEAQPPPPLSLSRAVSGASFEPQGPELLDEPALQVVQAEPGLPVEFTALPTRAGDEPATGMTLIARGQPARDMAAALQACVMSATYVEPRGCAGHV